MEPLHSVSSDAHLTAPSGVAHENGRLQVISTCPDSSVKTFATIQPRYPVKSETLSGTGYLVSAPSLRDYPKFTATTVPLTKVEITNSHSSYRDRLLTNDSLKASRGNTGSQNSFIVVKLFVQQLKTPLSIILGGVVGLVGIAMLLNQLPSSANIELTFLKVKISPGAYQMEKTTAVK